MKKYTYILFFLFIAFASCESDEGNDTGFDDSNPVSGLVKIQDFEDEDSPYTISLYNETGNLQLGYTKVYFTVKDKEGNYISDAVLSAFPEMDMGIAKHSTPRSEITPVTGKTLYEAYYSFLMYSGQGSGIWYYDIQYTIGNVTGNITDAVIDVKNAFRSDGVTDRKVVQSLVAIDGSEKRYVVSLVEPLNPKVGANQISAYVHERIDADTYLPVENFTLKIDPRMPSMGNHSSLNNVDLTWDAANRIHKGTVNFSMTGYWKLNFILLNEEGETLYGNPVTESVQSSSLYFEVEF
ncbi:MAG: hypothetical protein LBQ84_07435 [Flavobacteriaceae bacterium]|jgi:hypothetical protein|nr:hypothetical protein [Flavobacteriaceae bacterium]